MYLSAGVENNQIGGDPELTEILRQYSQAAPGLSSSSGEEEEEAQRTVREERTAPAAVYQSGGEQGGFFLPQQYYSHTRIYPRTGRSEEEVRPTTGPRIFQQQPVSSTSTVAPSVAQVPARQTARGKQKSSSIPAKHPVKNFPAKNPADRVVLRATDYLLGTSSTIVNTNNLINIEPREGTTGSIKSSGGRSSSSTIMLQLPTPAVVSPRLQLPPAPASPLVGFSSLGRVVPAGTIGITNSNTNIAPAGTTTGNITNSTTTRNNMNIFSSGPTTPTPTTHHNLGKINNTTRSQASPTSSNRSLLQFVPSEDAVLRALLEPYARAEAPAESVVPKDLMLAAKVGVLRDEREDGFSSENKVLVEGRSGSSSSIVDNNDIYSSSSRAAAPQGSSSNYLEESSKTSGRRTAEELKSVVREECRPQQEAVSSTSDAHEAQILRATTSPLSSCHPLLRSPASAGDHGYTNINSPVLVGDSPKEGATASQKYQAQRDELRGRGGTKRRRP